MKNICTGEACRIAGWLMKFFNSSKFNPPLVMGNFTASLVSRRPENLKFYLFNTLHLIKLQFFLTICKTDRDVATTPANIWDGETCKNN